ncbi:MAG: LytR/AlgR family response regulator transcription factor [Saprospiraceae bacterium]
MNLYVQTYRQPLTQWLLGILTALLVLMVLVGWLFQMATDSFCHTKLTIIFITSWIFWAALTPHLQQFASKWFARNPRWQQLMLPGFVLSFTLVGINQLLTRSAIVFVLYVFYGCSDVYDNWLFSAMTNNVLIHFLNCWLIIGATIVANHATISRKQVLVQTTANSMPDSEKPAGEAAAVTTLAIKNNNTTEILRFQEIIWLKSDNNCVEIQTTRKKFVLYRSLRSIEAELDPQQFVRIHRSAIVNRQFIQSIHHLPSGDGYVALTTGEEIRYSRNYKKGLMG